VEIQLSAGEEKIVKKKRKVSRDDEVIKRKVSRDDEVIKRKV